MACLRGIDSPCTQYGAIKVVKKQFKDTWIRLGFAMFGCRELYVLVYPK